MENKFKNKRRNYFINKKFQRNFIVKFCALAVCGAILSGGIVYMMTGRTVTTSFENLRLTMKTTADFMLPAVLLSTAVFVIFVALATVGMMLFTSHKIAGPLYRMEKDVDAVAGGDLTKKFNLREGDEIKPLAASLNNMTRLLRFDLNEIKRAARGVESAATPEERIEKMKNLKETIDKFKT